MWCVGCLYVDCETTSPKMNLEQTVTALSTQNEQFKQENDQLKAVLGIIQENRDLRATVQGFISADDSQGNVSFPPLESSKEAIQAFSMN